MKRLKVILQPLKEYGYFKTVDKVHSLVFLYPIMFLVFISVMQIL